MFLVNYYSVLCVIVISGFVSVTGNSLKDPYICGPPKCTPSDKFKYSPDIIYNYKYKVNVNTWYAGSSDNQSTIDIGANVAVQFLTPCEGLLQLSEITLSDQDDNYPVERSEQFVQALSQHELRFSFHDGVISEICPVEAEEEWILNFKRGLLSLYQNTMKRFDINFNGIERDIHGSCNVNYFIKGQENTGLVIMKNRDLTQCTDRYKYMSILQTVRYHFQSKYQTWPVLKSENKCRILIDHNIYKAVNCRERHTFEPFSGKNSGGMNTVVQDLVLVSEVNKTANEIMESQPKSWDAITARSNLLHHHTTYQGSSTGELQKARDVLKQLCNLKQRTESDQISTAEDELDSGSTVGVWGGLVRASRGLDVPPLQQLLARAPSICPEARKHMIDALPYIASVASVELIKDMILTNEVDDNTRHEWLMSMAMIPRPKIQMLGSMLELLKQQKNDKAISFTASSMVHSYCKSGGKDLRDCCEEDIPKQILEEFQSIINGYIKNGLQKAKRTDRDNLIVAIKAVGNMGGFKQEFVDVLMNMISDSLIPINIRLTAIDAFRHTHCTETREYFLEMYREDYVDIEVRLACYLQVMRCPTLTTITKIFHALKHEPVNQAATFVWSHLVNLAQSSLPSRVEIQGLLSGNQVPNLQDIPDFRLFSRNYEQSVFFDQYNAGGNYEANVIFSPDSYIPRSVGLNLTIDMFGESINLLEVKARAEGFERYFESIFGNSGPLSKNKFNDHLQKLRIFRSLNNATEVRRKIDDLKYKNEALKHQFPMAELGVKVFGNEISFWSAEGDDEIRKGLSRLNPQMRVLEIMSGKEISYNKASLFLDTTFSVPTGSGLPLNMNLMGTSYVDMKMSGTFVDGFKKDGNIDFEGKIHPSVSVNIAATMSVSAGRLSTSGVRVTSRLYTATAVEARLSLRGLRLVKLDLSLPKTKQEIFAAKSELIVLHGDKELQQQGLNKNRIQQNTCSWSAFDTAIGIKLCAAYQFPNMTNLRNAPYFILSGPSKYVLSLEKADPSAKTYSFQYKWDENATTNVVSLSFNTPDSKKKRSFNAEVTLSQKTSTALMSLESAQKTVQAKGMYRNTDDDKSLEASLDIDGKKHFDTLISFKRHDIKYGYVWVPHAYLVVNDGKVAELTGTLKVKTKGGVTQCDVACEFQTKQLASRLTGYYTINGPTHGTKLQLDYQFYKNPKQIVKIEGLYSERAAGYRHDLFGELSMDFTAYPHYNFYAVLKNIKTQSHLDINFNVSASRELKATPSFTFNLEQVDRLNGMKFDTGIMFVKPRPVRMSFLFEEIGSKYNTELLINFNPKQRDIIVSGFMYLPPGTQLYLDSELNMTLPNLHPLTVKAKVHEKQTNEFQVNAVGVWFTGTDFNIDALYQDQSKTNMASHRVKFLINSNQFKDVAVDARFTQDNRQITFIGQGEYNEDSYRTLVRYIVLSEHNFTAYAEVDVNGKAYNLNVNADMNNNTNLNMDVHIDQIRDVHISYSRTLSPVVRSVSGVVLWDANRDPGQRVSLDLTLHTPTDREAHFTSHLYYPGRSVDVDAGLVFRDWFCEWHIRTGWSPSDVLVWKVKMYSEAHVETVYALLSNLDTPFTGWKDTSFNIMWRYHDNFQAINGSMNWQEDHLSFGLLADYMFKTEEFYGEINAIVNSTIATLPKAHAVAKHRGIWKKSADTLLSFQYNEDGLLMINSSWLLDRGPTENNVTGKVTLITPFQGYKKGFLKTNFVFGNKKDVNGVTFLDLDEKVLKIYVNGHMRRITNCMLVINVTSPITQMSHMKAQFGFVETDRHLVALVTTPSSTTGFEVLLNLISFQDFNVYGHVALPIQYWNRAMLTAKRGSEEVDFRVGWGTMDFGFTAIWHYESIINFVYLYKLYTPLEGFEENGVVLKNVYGNGLDTELSVRLSKHKFGIAILLNDHERGILEALSKKINEKHATYDELIENFDTTAKIILDTLYYPTITFDGRIMKYVGSDEEDIIQANATLYLPNDQAIVLTDVFVLESFTEMRNNLHLKTPFEAVKELKSLYTVYIEFGVVTNVTCVVLVSNGTYWHEISSRLYYEYSSDEDSTYQSHVASVGVRTPLEVLPALDAAVQLRLEGQLWKMQADIGMPSFTINALGRLELDDLFVETSGSVNFSSVYLEDYFIKMEFKKDFSDSENAIGGGIQVTQGQQDNYLYADILWRPPSPQHVRFKAKAALNPVLPPSEVVSIFTYDKDLELRTVTTDITLGVDKYYSLKADQRKDSINVALSSPHEGFKAVKIIGQFENDDIRGSFTTDKTEYSITGKVLNRDPIEMILNLKPKGKGDALTLKIKCDFKPTVYAISAHFAGPIQVTVHTKAEMESNFTDINFKVDLPQSKNKEIYFKARVDSYDDLKKVVTIQAATPLKRLKYLKGDTEFNFGPKTGYVLCKYDMPDMKGDGDLKWSFLVGDLFIQALGHQHVQKQLRSIDLDIYFGNLTSNGLEKTNAGFRMDLDNIWQIGANASIGLKGYERINAIINVILPKPNVDVHTLYVDTVMSGGEENAYKSFIAKYTTDVTKITTGVNGQFSQLPDSFKANATVLWTSNSTLKSVDNFIVYDWDVNSSKAIDYVLISPLYDNEETFKVKGSYGKDMVHGYHVVKGIMHRPGSTHIGNVDVRYGGIKHTDGHFNITTPFNSLPWLRSVFNINNLNDHSDNKIRLFWSNNTATLNTTHDYTIQDNSHIQRGEISCSIPLQTEHFVNTQYYYVDSENSSQGNATIDLDQERFVKASFNQIISRSERNLDLSTTDIQVENEHTPVGIHYVHEYGETGEHDMKQATVFHLHDVTKFNVTGKADIHTYETGKDIKLTAIHDQQTLTFENVYEAIDKELKQGSKIKWAEDVWINYDIHVTNTTTADTESQQLIMNVWWPLRTFNLVAKYNLQDTLLDGSAVLNWNVKAENKSAELKGRWENPPMGDSNTHFVDLSLAHPSFRKDVTLKGVYIATPSIMSNVTLELQYSDYENEYLKFNSLLSDNSNGPIRDYKFYMTCTHPATNLDLNMHSDINIQKGWYNFDNFYKLQKTLFYSKLRQSKVLIDSDNKLIVYERANETYFTKLNGTWDLNYPYYKFYVWGNRTTGNDKGEAILSMNDKSLIAHFNSTDDISYHLIGMIVDTRSAKLNAWRNYDDVSTTDLASYIRLNHSRLLTSSIVWRPEIFSEIKSTAVGTLRHLYHQINETLVIIKEAPMEAHLALRGVWLDCKPRIREFLDDLNDLHVIKDDIDEFELFLNNSYAENNFYVKDIVEFTYYVLDEMALKDHLENLPAFVNDVWGLMGNTSQSIKQSLTYVIDNIKKAYANFIESTNKFLESDFMELVSERLEKAIMQYDNFIKDLHIKLLEYWETTWVNATSRLYKYWNDLLKSMEPLFFKVVYYTESFVITIWRNVMDFFYNRTQELTDSPYFNYVSTFGGEMDRIYKDLVNNDLITNVQKYSRKLWNLLWNKIEKYIPFKDEVIQLYQEFKEAYKNLMQTEAVIYVIEKCNEAYFRLKWWYDYFMIGEALEQIWDILYDKLTDMARTALQYEEQHRTPKTNFVFDPKKGEILLEQKLPMSWHAFNRTPDFSEIAEYKAVRDFFDEWLTSNKSIWSYYYEIRPYLDLNNILPPFGGMAMMSAQGTLVTYDKKVLTVSDPGTFLLTRDYKQRNFTVMMESNNQGRYNLLVLTKRNLVHVDLYKEQVSIGRQTALTLPTTVDGYTIFRETDTLTIQSQNGLVIQCNLIFRTCKLQISGWYYASVGGLLGTFNNEHYDDQQLPNNTYTDSLSLLTHSWNIEQDTKDLSPVENHEVKNDTQCEKFFKNKVSPLHPCFTVIDSTPFYSECIAGVEACTLASFYVELCSQQHIPIHIPEPCVQCMTPQGDVIEEGSFYTLEYVPNSTDVVFLIEAQYCNKDLRKNRNMELLVETLDSKLQGRGYSDNRYAVVGYGGSGVYKKPRSLYVDSHVFTTATGVIHHFDNFFIEKQDMSRGNKSRVRTDVFSALTAATSLRFRPGVPVLVVLMPCTNCHSGQRLDYSTIYHNLMENSITLHILMDDDFTLSKKRVAKYLFGIDSTQAFTNKDYERLVGDATIRRQIKLPKEKLGLCTSLAIETNGTIFAGKKLSTDRATARRFATVFGARLATVSSCGKPPVCECRDTALFCKPCYNRALMDLSFWSSEDLDDLIDMAMEAPTLSTFT